MPPLQDHPVNLRGASYTQSLERWKTGSATYLGTLFFPCLNFFSRPSLRAQFCSSSGTVARLCPLPRLPFASWCPVKSLGTFPFNSIVRQVKP